MPSHLTKSLVAAALAVMPIFAPALAEDGEAPGECLGIDFDQQHPIAIARIKPDMPRVHFIKSVTDDAACPADTATCRQKAYLVPGDMVLLGKAFPDKDHATFSCVVYESPAAKKSRWSGGWLPSASLAPVARAPAPGRSDWTGKWTHGGGDITIANGSNGTVTIKGEAFYEAAQNVHTGVIDAKAKPERDLLQFADDGSGAFDAPDAGCQVRMQRVDALLVVEDNNNCGGELVTFTGFYRRK